MQKPRFLAGVTKDGYEVPLQMQDSESAEMLRRYHAMKLDQKQLFGDIYDFKSPLGARRWQDCVDFDDRYHVAKHELETVKHSAKDIAELASDVSVVVELGSGCSPRTVHILKEILARQSKIEYIPMDLSENALEEGCKSLNDLSLEGLVINPFLGDFFKGLKSVKEQHNGERLLVLFLGCTLCSYSPEVMSSFLSEIQSYIDGDYLLLSYEPFCGDPAVHEYSYSHELQKKSGLVSVMQFIEDFEIDDDVSKFVQKSVWNPLLSSVDHTVIAQENFQWNVRIPALIEQNACTASEQKISEQEISEGETSEEETSIEETSEDEISKAVTPRQEASGEETSSNETSGEETSDFDVIRFSKGESILDMRSYKLDSDHLDQMFCGCGFDTVEHFHVDGNYVHFRLMRSRK